MTTYNLKRVRELANEKLIKDTGIEDIEPLSDEEFHLYFLLKNITENIDDWKFYITDDAYEKIVEPFTKLYNISSEILEDFSLDEHLEQIKMEREIKGFIELGNDLWMIRE